MSLMRQSIKVSVRKVKATLDNIDGLNLEDLRAPLCTPCKSGKKKMKSKED